MSNRNYRTEIPNIIDDMNLSLPAFRLYVHLKRVAGEGGASWEGVRRMADACNMSIGAVRRAKLELLDADLIRIDPGAGEQADFITIVDVWQKNTEQFGSQAATTDVPEVPEMSLDFEFTDTNSARLVTHPRASGDTPPRAKRHTPARLVTHPRAPGDTQERTNEERTNEERTIEEEGEIAREAPPAPALPKEVELKASTWLPKGMRFPGGFVPPGAGQNPVQVYYERFPIQDRAARLTPPQEADLVAHCPDLQRLREVVTAYSRTNYKPGNVQLVLDWYAAGVPNRYETRGPNGNQSQRSDRTNSATHRPSFPTYVREPYDAELDADLNGGKRSM
mgnify:FL=1